ncbi:unnamed protein product [Cochlearia groenlandica]
MGELKGSKGETQWTLKRTKKEKRRNQWSKPLKQTTEEDVMEPSWTLIPAPKQTAKEDWMEAPRTLILAVTKLLYKIVDPCTDHLLFWVDRFVLG